MAKSQETWNKKEKEKQRLKKREDKEQRKEERKANAGNKPEDMIAYVDENGNLSSTPPDPTKKKKIKADQIELGVPKREATEHNYNRTGVITFFNSSKGYGFIKDLESQESVFLHVNALTE